MADLKKTVGWDIKHSLSEAKRVANQPGAAERFNNSDQVTFKTRMASLHDKTDTKLRIIDETMAPKPFVDDEDELALGLEDPLTTGGDDFDLD